VTSRKDFFPRAGRTAALETLPHSQRKAKDKNLVSFILITEIKLDL